MNRAELAADLAALGVPRGGVVMVHARMSALGWVVGGSETVVRALLDALGPEGTLSAYASWTEHVYHASEWPAEHVDAYAAAPPVFDPATAEAERGHGRIPERIRTWPGAVRTAHPEASVVAVGARAEWLVAEQPDDDAYGARSPFARLGEAGGHVLMLGAPLDTITLFHHAEAVSTAPGKRLVTFGIPVVEDGRVVKREYTDIDTSRGAYPYETLGLHADEIQAVASKALSAGVGVRGRVGEADCHLFPAAAFTEVAVAWIDARFGTQPKR